MNNFLDDLAKVVILLKPRIIAWFKSQADSVFTFVSKYEKHEIKKIIEHEREKKEAVKSSSCQGTYEDERYLKDCSEFSKEIDCSKHSGCTWEETETGFEINPSPYHSCSGVYSSCYSCYCATQSGMDYRNLIINIVGGKEAYNSLGESKKFYYKRYKNRLNFEKAIEKFMRKY